MKKIAYILTWPFSQLFHLFVYLDSIKVGSFFAGFMLVLYLLCIGLVTLDCGFKLGFSIFLFFVVMLTIGIGNWVLETLIGHMLLCLQPLDQLHRHYSMRIMPWKRVDDRKIRVEYSKNGDPLDEFIRKNARTSCYQMKIIK